MNDPAALDPLSILDELPPIFALIAAVLAVVAPLAGAIVLAA